MSGADRLRAGGVAGSCSGICVGLSCCRSKWSTVVPPPAGDQVLPSSPVSAWSQPLPSGPATPSLALRCCSNLAGVQDLNVSVPALLDADGAIDLASDSGSAGRAEPRLVREGLLHGPRPNTHTCGATYPWSSRVVMAETIASSVLRLSVEALTRLALSLQSSSPFASLRSAPALRDSARSRRSFCSNGGTLAIGFSRAQERPLLRIQVRDVWTIGLVCLIRFLLEWVRRLRSLPAKSDG